MTDLICVWPQGFDYPPFRKFIRENRKRFKRVIIVWTNNHNGRDYRAEITQKMAQDDISFMQSPEHSGEKDWRSVAINHTLGYSDSEWIWFTEQDFFPKEGFWEEVAQREKIDDVFGIYIEGRLHPASIFIKRSLLDKTSKDFGADPGAQWDHFGRIQKDLEEMLDITWGYIPDKYWSHMNGLTHNLRLRQEKKKIGYRPREFYQYLRKAKEIERELDENTN